jgi:hypothetical protein
LLQQFAGSTDKEFFTMLAVLTAVAIVTIVATVATKKKKDLNEKNQSDRTRVAKHRRRQRKNARHKPCHYCSPLKVFRRTTENKKYISQLPLREDDFYAQCNTCGAYMCSRCMLKFYHCASPAAQATEWFQNLSLIYQRGTSCTFDGACCEIKQLRNEARWMEEMDRATFKDIMKNPSPCLDGMLYLPELALFLDSPNDCVDIHGFGGMCDQYGGLAHCVPSQSCVAKMMGVPTRPFSKSPAYQNPCLLESWAVTNLPWSAIRWAFTLTYLQKDVLAWRTNARLPTQL